jgi:hypothetical protein
VTNVRIRVSAESLKYVYKCDRLQPTDDRQTHRAHETVEHAYCERTATRERLCEIQFSVGLVVVVLIEELYVCVIY